jgi:hypothetical protein
MAIGLVAAAVLVAAACGGDDDDEDGGDDTTADGASSDEVLAELVGLLPVDETPRHVVAVDLAAARAAMGLDADQGFDVGSDDADVVRLSYAIGRVLIAPFARFDFESVESVVDTGAIDALAGGDVRTAIVVRTRQPWDDLTERLADAGFEQDGDRWIPDGDDADFAYDAVGRIGDDLVLASDDDALDAVLDGDGAPDTVLDALASVDGPMRSLYLGLGCVRSVALGDDVGERDATGTVIVTLDDDVERDRIQLTMEPVSADGPEVDGDTFSFTFTYRAATEPQPLAAVGALDGAVSRLSVYDCG